jgi:hypothetical protein
MHFKPSKLGVNKLSIINSEKVADKKLKSENC